MKPISNLTRFLTMKMTNVQQILAFIKKKNFLGHGNKYNRNRCYYENWT